MFNFQTKIHPINEIARNPLTTILKPSLLWPIREVRLFLTYVIQDVKDFGPLKCVGGQWIVPHLIPPAVLLVRSVQPPRKLIYCTV